MPARLIFPMAPLTVCLLLLSASGVSGVTKKQVTQLLDNLLINYNKGFRPGHGGKPLYIRAHILIRSMGPVTEIDMSYSMQLYYRQVWYDKRLAFNLENITELQLNNKFLHNIWKPDTYFLNGKKSYQHDITVPNIFLRMRKDGRLYVSRRLTIRARCPMVLRKYPMDEAICHLSLGSFGYSTDDIIYIWAHGSNSVEVTDVTMTQFEMRGLKVGNHTLYKNQAYYSILGVSFYFTRNLGFFILQTYLPCYLIVALSWISFWINRDAAPARVLLGVTTILSLAAIGMTVREGLPRVPYATALDIFLNMCLVYNLSALIEYAGVNYFTKTGPGSPPENEEDEKVLLPLSESNTHTIENVDAQHIVESCTTKIQRKKYSGSCANAFWNCLTGNTSYRYGKNSTMDKERGLSVSRIDKVARYVFPISFGIFNSIYWCVYLLSR
ncbi:gamma-aminobutyric acid receptor subunit alpha-5 isoform X2 [Octopus bimaculoides]|nr:gamma-aminobutyric acid receptor subunit alpha-5 isoform X2 [Octopus bimaculoides]